MEEQERQTHRTRWPWLLLIGLALLVAVPLGAFWLLYREVRPLTVWELTGEYPPASALMRDGGEGRWCFDTGKIDWKKPGDAVVLVAGSAGPRIAMVRQVDTTPPEARALAPVLGLDEEPGPETFITDLRDAQLVGVSFEEPPRFHEAGTWPVVVRLEDLSGNVSLVETTCTILGPVARLDMEAGEAVPPLSAFLPRDTASGRFLTDMDDLDTRTPGVRTVRVEARGQVYETALVIADTVAPQLSFPRKLQAYLDHPRPPAALLETAEDATTLTLSYVTEPDWTREGEQPVAIAGVDVVGNRTVIEGTVTLVPDRTPPELVGVATQYAYVGEPVTYFATVYARDNADDPADIALTVDNSAVDIYTPGRYSVIYRATDRAGNTAEKTVNLYFIRPSVSDEKLNEKADQVLATLVTDDMTQGQKAYAIYRYIYDTYTFKNNSSNKRDWKYEAWRGLTTRRGDCFTYCAAAKILLEKIGAKAMFVTRNHAFRHYWLMVDVGTGWYHFDPLNSGPSRKFQCFMLTTGQVLDLYPFFWKYDHMIYPDTPETPFVKDW